MTYLTTIIGVSIMLYLAYPKEQVKQQVVDLPEEYEYIASRESNKPDTVLAYYNNDTVFIQFKLK